MPIRRPQEQNQSAVVKKKTLASLSLLPPSFSRRAAERAWRTSRWRRCWNARSRAEGCHRRERARQADPCRCQVARRSSRATVTARGSIEPSCRGAQASRRSRAASLGAPAAAWPVSLVDARTAPSSRPVVVLRRPGGRERRAQVPWRPHGPRPWWPHASTPWCAAAVALAAWERA